MNSHSCSHQAQITTGAGATHCPPHYSILWQSIFQSLLIYLLVLWFGGFCACVVLFLVWFVFFCVFGSLVVFNCFCLVCLFLWVFFFVFGFFLPGTCCLKCQFSYCPRGPSEHAVPKPSSPFVGHSAQVPVWLGYSSLFCSSKHFSDEKRTLSRRSFHEVSPPSSSLQLGHTAVWCQIQQDAACQKALSIF